MGSLFRSISGSYHLTPLKYGDGSVDKYAQEGQSLNDEFVPLATALLVFGVGLNFYGMWNLKLGPENLWGVAALLVGNPSFMYSFGVILNVAMSEIGRFADCVA